MRLFSKFFITIAISIFASAAFSQDLIYTVSGTFDNQKIAIDSILFENLSNGTDLLFGNLPNQQDYQINLTTQELQNTTGIDQILIRDNYNLIRNTPGLLSIYCSRAQRGTVHLNVYNIQGQILHNASYMNLTAGSTINIRLAYAGVFIVELKNALGSVSYKGIGSHENSNYDVSIQESGSSFQQTLKSSLIEDVSDFSFDVGDSLRVSVYREGYYARPRAVEISSSSTVEFEFDISSATTNGVSDAYVSIDEELQSVIEYEVETGEVYLPVTDDTLEFFSGDIITIDADTTGFLRKITGIKEQDGVMVLETEQALMSELFVDTEFMLSTELIGPTQILKSTSSLEDISTAFTDELGFIHPVEVIYFTPEGNAVKKSALAFNDDVDTTDIISINYNFSGKPLVGEEGEAIHLYVEEGHVKFNSNAVFKFSFKLEEEHDENTKIRKGDLEYFEFYLKNTTDFLTKLALDVKKDFIEVYPNDIHHFEPITAKFIVPPGIPVWITFQVDILSNLIVDISASMNAEWGFQSIRTNKIGGLYDNIENELIPIKETSRDDTVFPLEVIGEVDAFSRFEVYPRVEMKFYSFLGPYAEIVPYVEGEFHASTQELSTPSGTKDIDCWNSKIDLGVDFRLGMTVDFIIWDRDIPVATINFTPLTLWETPVYLELISELPSNLDVGNTYQLLFRVTDKLDLSVPDCPVYISGGENSINEIGYTDFLGQVEFQWVIGESAGNYSFTAKIFDSQLTPIDAVTRSFDISAIEASLTTLEPNRIFSTKAYSGGNITGDGGAQISSRGVCWSTSPDPTISDDTTQNGSGLGEFESFMYGLSPETIYYVKAYAINEAGVAYGNQKTFTTTAPPTYPIVTTYSISDIGITSARSGGNVTSDGGSTVIVKGVCYSKNENPTATNLITTDGEGEGGFTSHMTDLEPNTTYYVRAYALNNVDYGYGNQRSFKTDAEGGTVTDYDGNVYQTVQIGGQGWMAENLKTTHYSDGSPIPLVEDNSTWAGLASTAKAYCWYNNSTSNRDTYGGLYTWAAAMNGSATSGSNPSGVQGVCPSGWHMPSDSEWNELKNYLGGADVAGGKMKETGTAHWNSPNTAATNESGFTALAGGSRSYTGLFENMGIDAPFWSATQYTSGYAWNHVLNYDYASMVVGYGNKIRGREIRCVKD